MLATTLGRVRAVGMAEGVSFLLLVGVGMPLKYAAGLPMAVKIAGWIHGALFMALFFLVAHAKATEDWPWGRAFLVMGAALVPFGPFLIDKRLRESAEVSPRLNVNPESG